MKAKLLLVFMAVTFWSTAQKVLVTDFKNIYVQLNGSGFLQQMVPQYFDNPSTIGAFEFALKEELAKKLHTNDIQFLEGYYEHKEGLLYGKFNYEQKNITGADYYVAIISALNLATEDVNGATIVFTVRIYDKKKKKYFKYKTVLTLNSINTGYVAQKALVSEYDYVTAHKYLLAETFKAEKHDLAMMDIYRPVSDEYKSFTDSCFYGWFERNNELYTYSTEEATWDILESNARFWGSSSATNDWFNVFQTDALRKSYKVNNLLSNENLIIRFKVKNTQLFDILHLEGTTSIEIKKDKENCGELTLYEDKMEGDFKMHHYKFQNIDQSFVKVSIDGQFSAILVYTGYSVALYHLKTMPDSQFNDLCTTLFMYDYAFEIARMSAEQSN